MSLSSAARDLLTTLMIGSSILWEMMLWLSLSIIFKNKAALNTQKGANLGLKCVRMRLAAGLCPDPLGELMHSPRRPSCNGGLLRRGMERRQGKKERTEREEGEFPAKSR